MTERGVARFGNYEILHELKSGGMGSVLLARRRGPGTFEQVVAIKTIRPEYAATPAVRAMFLDEAAILARIHHPGIATVHDFGEEGATLYMVMEYVAGIPFRDIVEVKPPPIVIARAIAEACRGLHAAHELRDHAGALQGLVHRDISPDNLMLGYDGHVKVIDFGIALVKKNRQAPVTEFGTVKGKPPYMSPEQVANEAMDRRSDVFSLAVVLWELVTQKPLFVGDSIYAIAIAVQQQTILPPSQLTAEPLPLGLDAVVMNALDRDPERRTPTAAAFAEQLEQVIQQAGGESLTAWTERALGTSREQHRAWIGAIITGAELPKLVVGRATGQVTELAPIGIADTPPALLPAVAPIVPEPPARTSIGGTAMDDLSVPPRNRLAPIILALLALLAVGGGVVFLMTRDQKSTAVVAHDAAAPPLDAAPPADATELVDAAEVDAGVTMIPARIDAGVRRALVDAGRPVPRDAAPIPVRPDAAAPTPAPTGHGLVTMIFKGGMAASTIGIDGAAPVAGPINKRKLAAGKHVITFHHPSTGEVLDRQEITVKDGDVLVIRQQ